VIEAHPVLGVGNDNFVLVSSQYINRPGAIQALYFINTPKLTHNTFLEAFADLGIPGLLTLVAVLGFCIASAVRAAWIFEALGDRDMELMARAVVLAIVAIITSDMFVAAAYAKYLWIPLAICPALLALARRAEQSGAVPAPAQALPEP
jgi:O-antigen ligase